MTFSERLKKLCRTSLFISLMMRLVNAVYDCLRDGFFGRVMTAYDSEDKKFRKGIIGHFFSRRGIASKWVRKIRLRLSEFFEKSVLLGIGMKKSTYLLGCSLRVYGIFLLTFGVYTVLTHYIKYYAFPNFIHNNISLMVGAIAVILGIPMIGSRNSLAELLQKGLLPHLILVDVFGIPEERFDIPRVKGGGRYNSALLLGMLLGVLTFVIPAQYILLFLLGLIGATIVMSYPEIGVLALIALMPFLACMEDSSILNLAILLTAVAYLGKLIRGKRIIRFTLIDTLVLLLGLLLWLGGMVSVGGEASSRQAWHICQLLLMYFMIVNLIRTPAWLHRAVLACVGSASILALGTVLGYVDSVRVSTAPIHLSSIFEQPWMYGTYLALLLPFMVAIMVTSVEGKGRSVAAWCVLIILSALVFTGSWGAWFGAVIALLVFLLIYSRKTVCWLILGGLTVPIWQWFFPQNVFDRLFCMVDMTNPAVYQRVSTWSGTIEMISEHLLGGIGYGSSAFREVYPRYGFTGMARVENAENMYLSFVSAVGLFGLLVFIIVIVIFAQQCLGYIGNASEAYSRTFVAAGFSGVLGALVTGIHYDIWYDEAVFLTFFTVLALTCAYVRAGVLIRTRNQDVSGIDVSHAHVDLYFEV